MQHQQTPCRRAVRFATAGVFFVFFLFGFVENVKGPTLPAVLAELQLSYVQGGTVLLGGYVGFLTATLITGFFADRAGKKNRCIRRGAPRR